MITKKIPFALLLLLLLWSTVVRAGVVAPGLEILLRDRAEDDPIKVLVVLDDQADVQALDRDLRGAKAALPQRHRLVVESLRSVAAVSQASLLADLAAKTGSGRVLGFVPHWLVNSVVVTATPSAVREIAARPDVARVEPDLAVSLISPVPGLKSISSPETADGIGIAPGVRAVGAPRVWEELGIDGTGVLVGILDTGVDGSHPALASRWRGNFAPASECWLDAVGFGDTSFPVDRDPDGHGTHVMGVLTGLAPGDTIGVAPGAWWIAANTIGAGVGHLDNALLASLEFMTDPDGDPATTDDVPDVVSNSWGVSAAFLNYYDCDSRWWDAIDNIEAAGVVLLWAAGNEGPYIRSVRSPADRAASPLNCFAIGATETVDPFEVSEFSSRGPSDCGGPHEIKPEVVAPGRDIYSARPGGVYQLLSGTSVAVPHVAGVVALMRQANPDLDVVSLKEILISTAIDKGSPGDDISYGHGFIDAFAAVSAALDQVATVTGTITDRTTGLPLAEAGIVKMGGLNRTFTDSDGRFNLTMVGGLASFQVSKFGYFDGAFSAPLVPSMTSHAVALDPVPAATISGLVFGPDDLPVVGATVAPPDLPVEPSLTDASGYYELELPKGPGLVYQLEGRAPGLGSDFQTLELAEDQTLDFHLPEQFREDFESMDFHSFDWVTGGDVPWLIDPATKFEGGFSARSGDVRNLENSFLALDYYVSVDSYLQFQCKVSTEYYYDTLVFYLDGVEVDSWSGEWDWFRFRQAIPRGHHNFAWVYQRDVAYREGDNTVWLDLIEFPTTGEELFPTVSLDVPAFPVTMGVGDPAKTIPFTITNTGDWALDFSISVGDLVKGGPDTFGYEWVDSDDSLGPVFDWVDISADGTFAGTGDDEILGPFPLEFGFEFYGIKYQSVYISTNGFLSFTPVDLIGAPRGVPDLWPPDNLLAVFWDDLYPVGGGTIYYKPEPENDRFIVQFEQVIRAATGAPETFQVILRRDGTIVFQYAEVQETDQCTIGIENHLGDDGLLVLHHRENYLHDEMAILFEPPVFVATVAPTGGQLAPGESLPATVTVDAAGLAPGFHVAVIYINSNAEDPELLVPVLLTVNDVSRVPDVGLPRAVTFSGAVPNPFNPVTHLQFSLPAAAEVELTLYDVSGRRVRSLVSGHLPAGPHAAPWYGNDVAGRDVASGTYFARLTVDGVSSVKSVTLVR